MTSPRTWLNRPRNIITRGNLTAGAAVGGYIIPQAMAYGELAGIGPATGLTMAIIPLLLYPLLGSSRLLAVGPESATALMAAVTIAPIAAHHPDSAPALMGTLTILVGLVMLAARLLRAGVIADLLSRPVLLGYTAGIAILIVESQTPKLLGPDINTENLLTFLTSLPNAAVQPGQIAVASVTAATLWACSRWARKLPGAILALTAGAILGAILGTPTIDDAHFALPTGFGTLPVGVLGELLVAALAVTVVAYSDTILTARAFADKGERINANRELVAGGIIQTLNGLTGAYPASSSTTRTALAKASHATNSFYSWTVLAILIALPLAAGPLLTQIPVAALAGVVLYAGVRLIDVAALTALGRFRIRELGIALATTAGVVTLGILPGIAIAVALSVSELLARLMRPHEGTLGFVPDLAGMHDIDDHPTAEQIPGLVVYRYDAPIFFANSNDFYNQVVQAVENTTPPVHWLVLNMEANVEVDYTGLEALEQIHDELTERGIRLVLARVKNDLRIPLERYGLLTAIGEQNIYPTLPTAVDAYRTWAADHTTDTEPAGTQKIARKTAPRYARTDDTARRPSRPAGPAGPAVPSAVAGPHAPTGAPPASPSAPPSAPPSA